MANIRTGHRSGFLQRGGVRRRESLWISIVTVEVTLGGAPTAVLLLALNAAALALRPFTIVRTRGVIFCRSDQTDNAETFIGDLGAAVVSDQAVAAGVTAVPTPLTDKGSDLWFLYEQLPSRQAGTTPTGLTQNVGVSKEFDSKAMRKVEQGQDVVFVGENEIAGLNMIISGRMLIKLH